MNLSRTQHLINRDNHRCLSIEKWRYNATFTLIKYVEACCSSIIKVLRYQFVGDDQKILRNVEISLIKPKVRQCSMISYGKLHRSDMLPKCRPLMATATILFKVT